MPKLQQVKLKCPADQIEFEYDFTAEKKSGGGAMGALDVDVPDSDVSSVVTVYATCPAGHTYAYTVHVS